jgi:UDP-perosamine 4-acetyltransferase
MKPRIICFGAGGHAAVLVDLLQLLERAGHVDVTGIVAVDGPISVLGVPLLGHDDDLPKIIRRTGSTHFVIGVGSIRANDTRRARLFDFGQSHNIGPYAAIHPTAIVASSALVGPGATVMAGAVIQARANIGRNAIVNTGALVDHDTVVGPHSHVAPGVTCSGGVTVGEGCHIGAGAVIREGVTIGANTTVGAGAVVISDCPAGITVTGVPAKPHR